MKIIRFIKLYFSYLTLRVKPNISGAKIIFIDIDNPDIFHRHLLALLYFFREKNYLIYIKPSLLRFRAIRNIEYLNLILKEIIRIGYPPIQNKILKLSEMNLQKEYFSFYEKGRSSQDYYIPMSMYPPLYKTEYKEKFNDEGRVNSFIFIGNFSDSYNRFRRSKYKMEGRMEMYNYLINNKSLLNVTTSLLYTNRKVIILNSNTSRIDVNKMRETLSKYQWFLAFPGAFKPYCHNLIEALSVKCIPLIHVEYAELMNPPLEDLVNCITYKSINELQNKINYCLNLDDVTKNIILDNINNYYLEYLSPEAVVNNIEINKYNKIFLQSSDESDI